MTGARNPLATPLAYLQVSRPGSEDAAWFELLVHRAFERLLGNVGASYAAGGPDCAAAATAATDAAVQAAGAGAGAGTCGRVCVCVRVCLRAWDAWVWVCVRGYVRVCVHACVCVCVHMPVQMPVCVACQLMLRLASGADPPHPRPLSTSTCNMHLTHTHTPPWRLPPRRGAGRAGERGACGVAVCRVHRGPGRHPH